MDDGQGTMELFSMWLLIGNYGTGNLGDEALKDVCIEHLSAKWRVVGDDIPRLPCGVRSLFTPWWKTLFAYVRCKGIVFGGGSLFTDSESCFACLLWFLHALPARVLGKKIILAFQGIGPCTSLTAQLLSKRVCMWANCIVVRDAESKKRLDAWGIESTEAFDPVFLSLKQEKVVPASPTLGIIPRHNSGAITIPDEFDDVFIISMQPDNAEERRICNELVLHTGGTLICCDTLKDLTVAVSRCSHIVSARFHGALAALAADVPYEVVVQKEGDKLSAIADMNHDSIPHLLSKIDSGFSAIQRAMNGTIYGNGY